MNTSVSDKVKPEIKNLGRKSEMLNLEPRDKGEVNHLSLTRSLELGNLRRVSSKLGKWTRKG